MILFKLFYEFFLTGLFAIGGGLATLPFLNKMGLRTGWFTSADLANMLAVAESTPGPIGINMATYVGFEVGDIFGAAIATIALIMPSLIIALILVGILRKFSDNEYVLGALYGLRPASIGLISIALLYVIGATFFVGAFDFAKLGEAVVNYKAIALSAIVFVFVVFVKPTKKLHPIIYIVISAIVGVMFKFSS